MEKNKTLTFGSLFDGSGGFNLIKTSSGGYFQWRMKYGNLSPNSRKNIK